MDLQVASQAIGVHVNAPYGKACLNCVKSKTKCVNLASDGKCERCQRLNKDCQPAPPTIRRKRAPNKPKSSSSAAKGKASALEEKLDSLVQILQRSQPSQVPISFPTSSPGTPNCLDQTQRKSVQSTGSNYENLGSSSVCVAGKDFYDSGRGQVEERRFEPNGSFLHARTSKTAKIWSRALMEKLDPCAVQLPLTPSLSCASTPDVRNMGTYCSLADVSTASTHHSHSIAEQADLKGYLDTFRMEMMPNLPIVVIKEDITVMEIMERSPFLWLVIRAICSKNMPMQTALGVEIKKNLAREMIFNGTKTLDLLLGLLVLGSWGDYHNLTKPILSTVVQLAMSLAFDLGIMKPVPTESILVMRKYSFRGCPKSSKVGTRTMEERRTAIGLFLLTSVCSSYFQRIEPMQWTPYLEQCLQLLEKSNDHSADILLVYLVRTQLISNEAAHVTQTENLDDTTTKVAPEFYLKVLQSQLHELKRDIPPDLQNNSILKLHIHHTELNLHEYSLNHTFKNISSDPSRQLQQIQDLWTCLTETKSWFSIFSSEDFLLSCSPQLSIAVITQFAHCVIAMWRIVTFESPDVPWDLQLARKELDLGKMFRLLSDRWGALPAGAGLVTSTGDEKTMNMWTFTQKWLANLANFWDAEISTTTATGAESEGGYGVGRGRSNDNQIDGVETMDFMATDMDFLDDAWMRELLSGQFEDTLGVSL